MGFGGDPFRREDSNSEDEFDFGMGRELMRFNNNDMMRMGGGGGTSYSSSVSYQTFFDKNGKKQVKKVQKTHKKNVDETGNVIEDFEELYKDTKNGVNRIQKAKRLNDKGMKVTRENRNGELNEERHFHNMDEDELDEFITRYQKHSKPMMIKQNREYYLYLYIYINYIT